MATNDEGNGEDGRVQFAVDMTAEAKTKRRLELTQRYDRKQVQKRLDIESWMDEQMRILYGCEVNVQNYIHTTVPCLSRRFDEAYNVCSKMWSPLLWVAPPLHRESIRVSVPNTCTCSKKFATGSLCSLITVITREITARVY